MKALTIWQPWATLIMAGAKPYEFRHWDYRARERGLEGQRIVIHAGARKISREEVQEILLRIEAGHSALKPELARPIVERALTSPGSLPLASGLGTAILGTPRKASHLFRGVVPEQDIDPVVWAWPLSAIEVFAHPVPARGFQGFWTWPERVG